MSAPFDMPTTWQDPSAPQLEDYTFDGSFNMTQVSIQHQPVRRQVAPPRQNPSFAFSQNFTPQQSFEFNVQPPQTQQMDASSTQGFFAHSVSPGPSPQQPQYASTTDVFAGTAGHQRHSSMNASQFPNNSYYSQLNASSPSPVGFDAGPSQVHEPVYSSPPVGFTPTYAQNGTGYQQQPQYYDSDIGGPDMYGAHPAKRPRPELYEPEREPEAEAGGSGKGAEAAKRPACQRCKGLKVKCEFKTDPDICKRCLNGGHECVIPGRKKRRAPPKREHLLSQIRDQADRINKLMAELEKANRKVNEVQAGISNAPSPGSTTGESVTSLSTRLLSPDYDGDTNSPEFAKTNADVQDWLTKARESMEAFGGYLRLGGPGVTRDMVAEEGEDEDNENSSPPFDEGDVEYGIDVEDPEGDDSDNEGSVDTSRRPGLAAPTSETRSKERLLTLPPEEAPLGLMAKLSLDQPLRRMKSKSSLASNDKEEKEEVGLAAQDYFRPSPAQERGASTANDQQVPPILRTELISLAEVDKLFKIYWDYMNLSVSLLDPALYGTASQTVARSPFLFTVICGIASRFYTERPDLYQQAMHYARLAAGTALIGGEKKVETVHAFILLALYPVPSRKWEDDRSWIYLGVAIRIAQDLNLHHPITAKPRDEAHAREMLNRTRAWLNCYNLDRSMGSQYGKAPIIRNDDYVANRSAQWWNSSDYNMKNFDIHLAGYNSDLTIMGGFAAQVRSDPNSPTGFNKDLNIADLACKIDDELAGKWNYWSEQIRQHNDPNDRHATFRTGLLRLAYSYARMNALSFGFQYAFGKNNLGRDVDLLERCLRAANDVLIAVLEDIAVPEQKIYLRHGPEAQCVFIAFASAFLIKLLHPRYATYIGEEKRTEIRTNVQKIIDLLGSPEVSLDDRHGPRLYSRFLQGLLDAARLVKRSPAKAKTVSPSAHKSELYDSSGLGGVGYKNRVPSSAPSSARQSMSPEPNGLAANANANTMLGSLLSQEPAAMESPDFFQPPIAIESDLLLNPSIWPPDVAMPGFGWINSNNGFNNTDIQMGYYGSSSSINAS